MLVYVLSKAGKPLMPTARCGKVRRMLRDGLARVTRRTPFTIQLLYETGSEMQDITLGVDAGSRHIGISCTTAKKELYASEVELRDDIVRLLADRREKRRGRRHRKTRYRKVRFLNRKRDDGWLAPSIRHKIQTHLSAVQGVFQILPVTHIVVETASFDIQKIKNPDISGTEYQEGEQFDFWNVREYVLFRDGHQCQCCHGKSKDRILNVHHIESRRTGGDAPNNLITLCETCHTKYHQGKIELPETIKRGARYKDAAFMGIMRWAFYRVLKETYPSVSMTYGYITKNTRIRNGLPKTHCVDARCISGNPLAEPLDYYFYKKKVRRHNRRIHKDTINKGGIRKKNQSARIIKGFRLFDKVRYNGETCFIFGKRTSGYFMLKHADGELVTNSASWKKLTLLELSNGFIIERRPRNAERFYSHD